MQVTLGHLHARDAAVCITPRAILVGAEIQTSALRYLMLAALVDPRCNLRDQPSLLRRLPIRTGRARRASAGLARLSLGAAPPGVVRGALSYLLEQMAILLEAALRRQKSIRNHMFIIAPL